MFFSSFKMKKWGNATSKKIYLLVVKKTSQDGTVDNLVDGMAVIVVGEEFVNLRAEDLDGGTRRHHKKKDHHICCSRHC